MTKLKTTAWRKVRKRAVTPEDEPRIADERQALEAELAVRRAAKPAGQPSPNDSPSACRTSPS